MDGSPPRSVSRSGGTPRVSRVRSKMSSKQSLNSNTSSLPALTATPLVESTQHDYITAKTALSLLSSTIQSTHTPGTTQEKALLITDAYVNISGHKPADPNSRGMDFSRLSKESRHQTAVHFINRAKTVRQAVRAQSKVDIALPEFSDTSVLDDPVVAVAVASSEDCSFVTDSGGRVSQTWPTSSATLLIPARRPVNSVENENLLAWMLACGWSNEQEMCTDVFGDEPVTDDSRALLQKTMKDIARDVSKLSSDMHELREAQQDGNLKCKVIRKIEDQIGQQHLKKFKNTGLLTSIVSPVPGVPAFVFKPGSILYPISKQGEQGITSRLQKQLTKRQQTKKENESVWETSVQSVEEEKLMVGSLNQMVEQQDESDVFPDHLVTPEVAVEEAGSESEGDTDAWVSTNRVHSRAQGLEAVDLPRPQVIPNHLVWRSLLLPNEVAPGFTSSEVATLREQVRAYKEDTPMDTRESSFQSYQAFLEPSGEELGDSKMQPVLNSGNKGQDTFSLPSHNLHFLHVRAPPVLDLSQGSQLPATPALLYVPPTVPERPVLQMFAPYVYAEGMDMRYHINSVLTPHNPTADTDQQHLYARGCTSTAEFLQHEQYNNLHSVQRARRQMHPLQQLARYAVLHSQSSHVLTLLEQAATELRMLESPSTPQLPTTLPYIYNWEGCSYQSYLTNLHQLSQPNNTVKKQSSSQSPQDALRDQVNAEKRVLWNTCYHPEGLVLYNPLHLLQFTSVGGPEPVKSPLLMQQLALQSAKQAKLPWGVLPSSLASDSNTSSQKNTTSTNGGSNHHGVNNHNSTSIHARKLTEVGSTSGCFIAPAMPFHKNKTHKQVKSVTNWLFGAVDVLETEDEEMKRLHALEMLVSDKESTTTSEVHLFQRDVVGSDNDEDTHTDPFISYTRRFSAVYKVVPELQDDYNTPIFSADPPVGNDDIPVMNLPNIGESAEDGEQMDDNQNEPTELIEENFREDIANQNEMIDDDDDDESNNNNNNNDKLPKQSEQTTIESSNGGSLVMPSNLALHLSADTLIHFDAAQSPQHQHSQSFIEDSSASQASMNLPVLTSLHVDKSITVMRVSKGANVQPHQTEPTGDSISTSSTPLRCMRNDGRVYSPKNVPQSPATAKNNISVAHIGSQRQKQPVQQQSQYWWEASAIERQTQVKGMTWADKVQLVTRLLRQGQSILARKGRVEGRGYTGGGKGERKVKQRATVQKESEPGDDNIYVTNNDDDDDGNTAPQHQGGDDEEDLLGYSDENSTENADEDDEGYASSNSQSDNESSQFDDSFMPQLPSFVYHSTADSGEGMYQQSLVAKVEHIWKLSGLGPEEQMLWLERAKPRFQRNIWLWTQALTLFQLRSVLRSRISEITKQLQDHKWVRPSNDQKRAMLQTSKLCELYRACCQALLQFLQLTSAVCIVCLTAETVYSEPITINGVPMCNLVKADYNVYRSAFDIIHDIEIQNMLSKRIHVESLPLNHDEALLACEAVLKASGSACKLHPMVLPPTLHKCIPLKLWGITSGEERAQKLLHNLFGIAATGAQEQQNVPSIVHSLVDGLQSAAESLKRQFPDSYYAADSALEHVMRGDEDGEVDLFDVNNDVKAAANYANLSAHTDQGDYAEDVLGFFLRQTLEKHNNVHHQMITVENGSNTTNLETNNIETQQFELTADVYSLYKGSGYSPVPFIVHRNTTASKSVVELPPETARVDAVNALAAMRGANNVSLTTEAHRTMLRDQAQHNWQLQLRQRAISFVVQQTRKEKQEERRRTRWMATLAPEVFQYQEIWNSSVSDDMKLARVKSKRTPTNITSTNSTNSIQTTVPTDDHTISTSSSLPPVITPHLQPLALLTAERVATIMANKTIRVPSNKTTQPLTNTKKITPTHVNPFSIKRTQTVKQDKKELSITTMAAIQARIIGRNNKL